MPGGFEWLFMMVIVLGSIGLFIYVLVDILKSEFTNSDPATLIHTWNLKTSKLK